MKRFVCMVAVGSLMMSVGCIKPGAGATPEETLKNLVGALQAGDGLAVVDCFKANAAGKEALKIQCSSTKALLDFSAKMTAAYGADTLKHFGFGDDPFSNLIDHIGEAKIVTSGDDRATATVPGWGAPIQLVKDSATMLWRIGGTRYTEMTEAELNRGFRTTRHLRDAMIMLMNEIGVEGVTANTIVEKMENYVMAELAKPAVPIHVPPEQPQPEPADPHASPSRPALPTLPKPEPARPTLPDLPKPTPPSSRMELPDLPPPPLNPAGHGRLPLPRPVYADLSTPQKTVAFMANALRSGNGLAMARCFKTNAEGKQGLIVITEAMMTMLDFSTKMEAAYGKKVGTIGDDARAILANFSKATITVDGDKATARIPDSETLELVRENGQWLIYQNNIANATKKEVDAMVAQTKPMIAAMKSMMPKIGQPGQTAETIAKGVKDATQAAMK